MGDRASDLQGKVDWPIKLTVLIDLTNVLPNKSGNQHKYIAYYGR